MSGPSQSRPLMEGPHQRAYAASFQSDKYVHYYLSATATISGQCVPESELEALQTWSQLTL